MISQAVSGLGCFLFILKKMPLLHVGREDLKPRPRYMKRLCGMGLPMGLQTSITAVGNVIPVSYTHLDVYKRQVSNRSFSPRNRARFCRRQAASSSRPVREYFGVSNSFGEIPSMPSAS